MIYTGSPFHWFYILAGLVCLAIPIAVIIGAVVLMRRQPPQPGASAPAAPPPPPPSSQGSGQSPRDILDRRFASGEITAEEYQKSRDLLEGKPPPTG